MITESILKVLIVVTSHNQMGNTGKLTGYYLPEVSHPALALKKQGLDFDILSPKGGEAPMDETSRDLTDPQNKEFLSNPVFVKKLKNTLKPSQVNPSDYSAILYAGGHGTMWDFRDNNELSTLASRIYERGGIIAAVCHGPAALLNIKLSNSEYLIKGKKLTGFSNAEEEAAGLTKVMPFLLETELKARGGIYTNTSVWKKNVIVDGRLVTGQNPASAESVGVEIAKLLKK